MEPFLLRDINRTREPRLLLQVFVLPISQKIDENDLSGNGNTIAPSAQVPSHGTSEDEQNVNKSRDGGIDEERATLTTFFSKTGNSQQDVYLQKLQHLLPSPIIISDSFNVFQSFHLHQLQNLILFPLLETACKIL